MSTESKVRFEQNGAPGDADARQPAAGKGTAVPATRETPEQFREVIDINLNGSN